ncbi:U3 small nucleolar [Globisporangium polare]
MDPVAVEAFESKVLQKPELFFTPSEQVASDIKQFTKHVFDHCTKFVSQSSVTPLDQLYIDGFDADQIWEQLQLQNGPLVSELAKRIRGFNKQPESIRLFPTEKDDADEQDDEAEEEQENDDDAEEEDDDDDATANSSEDEDDEAEDSDDGARAKKSAASLKKKKTTVAASKKKDKASKQKKERDVAEDGFFDWDEMDRAAEEEEEDADEDLDLNADLDSEDDDDMEGDDDDDDDSDDEEMEEASDDEDAKDMKFGDFFDGPDGEGGEEEEEEEEDDEDANLDEGDDEDDDEFPTINREKYTDEDAGDEDDMAERGILSSHQRQQLRLKKEITELEKEALGEKPWVLKGEVKSSARPENSLLEAILDYDRPGKVAPVITVEVSVALEEMIKKRILEDDFDDVIRKFAGNEQDAKNKLEEVSMEKSKEGLGEVYEKEYMKTAMGFEMDDESKQDQAEIDIMFKSLCWKLDALSNYQFTPKPMVKELQVKPSVPAIAMEEVVPISVSDANLKAPEEIYEKKRKRGEAVLQSKDEMSQEQRKAQRNAKKQSRRKENKQKEADERLVAKLNPGLGNKYAKKKLMESLASAKNVTTGKAIEGSTKQFSNSKEFFTRLQEEVKGQIQKKTKADSQ